MGGDLQDPEEHEHHHIDVGALTDQLAQLNRENGMLAQRLGALGISPDVSPLVLATILDIMGIGEDDVRRLQANLRLAQYINGHVSAVINQAEHARVSAALAGGTLLGPNGKGRA